MHRINAPITPLEVTSADGTLIRAYLCGTGPHLWLLPPGLGTPLLGWKYLLEHFADRMTIVTWDPRACYQSRAPERPESLGIPFHVEDGVAVLKAAGWENKSFVLGGWSMGIQISLELYRRFKPQVQAMVLINGTFEHVLKTAFPYPVIKDVLPHLVQGVATASPLFAPISRHLLGQPWAISLLKRLGIVTANRDFFGQVVSCFRELDFTNYFPMMVQINRHSARDVLPTVNVPTLITAGTMDKMTPMSVSRFMQERIPGSELFVVENGTHYTTIEYPDVINANLTEFFKNKVFRADW